MVTKEGEGYYGELSEKQNKVFKDFKDIAQQLAKDQWKYDLSQFDDYDYLRFLRARKFDLKKTLDMFGKYIQWRIDFGVDNIFVFFINSH